MDFAQSAQNESGMLKAELAQAMTSMNKTSKEPKHFAVDFDGTAAEHSNEFKNYPRMGLPTEPIFGPLLPWFKRFIRIAIQGGHKVTIFTARDISQHPLISQYIEAETGFLIPVTNTKLKCFDIFIDDRAVRFNGEEPPSWQLELEPWWKK